MLTFTSPGGFEVLVGQNSRENDRLTLTASGMDLWFHASGVAGAHVILRRPSAQSIVGEDCRRFAAELAAKHSKAIGGKGKVDVCLAIDVTKDKWAAPGEVMIRNSSLIKV